MTYLKLNNITIPVAKGGEVEPQEIGSKKRAFDGTLSADRRDIKRMWKYETKPLTASLARTLRGLVMGEGHYWSYNSDLYSDKGLGASNTPTTTFISNTAGDGDAVKVQSLDSPETTRNASFRTTGVAIDIASTNIFAAAIRDCESDPLNDFSASAGATLSNESSDYWEGAQSLGITTTPGGVRYAETPATAVSGDTDYTASVYLKLESGTGTVNILLYDDTGGAGSGTSKNVTLAADTWIRAFVTHTTDSVASTATLRIGDQAAGDATVFYADGLQLEANAFPTQWYDGDRSTQVCINYSNQLLTPIDQLTFAFWLHSSDLFKNGGDPDQYIATFRESADQNEIQIRIRNSDFKIIQTTSDQNGATVTNTSTTVFDDGLWHHIAVTFNNKTKITTLYIDGASEDTSTSADIINFSLISANGLVVGGETTTTSLNSVLDDVIFLPFLMTADEIAELYNSGSGTTFPLPRLIATGDFTTDNEVEVIGTVNRETVVGVQRSGSWENNNHIIDFAIEET